MDGGGATVVMGWRLSVPLVKDRDFRVVVGIGGVALVVIVIVLAASKVCVVFVLWVVLEVRSMFVVPSRGDITRGERKYEREKMGERGGLGFWTSLKHGVGRMNCWDGRGKGARKKKRGEGGNGLEERE